MCLCWKGLGKLLTDGPAWQNWNVCHQACFFFPPSTCKHCPHDLCIFCCCQQLISSNQNVHLPCHVPCAFSLCSSAICLFCNTVLLAFLFLILSVALSPFKIENPAFLLRFCKCIKCSMLQLYWLGECISNVLEGVYVQQ